MKAGVTHAGASRPAFTSELKASRSADGTVATVYTEFDRRDPDKLQHRYIKKVTAGSGQVLKDVDGFLTNQALHGNTGVMRDAPSRPVPGDPMTIRVGMRQPTTD